MKKFSVLKRLLTAFFILGLGFITKGQTYTIGTATTANATSGYPAPYGNYYGSSKHQILITKAELNAAGMVGACKITSLAFSVKTPAGTPLSGFTIGIKQTATTALAATAGSWETGLTTVYGPANYTDVAGWNTHNFSTPFCWDGTSNILIQTCFYNSSFSSNSQMYYTTSAANSVHFINADGASQCPLTSAGTANKLRPNIKITTAPAALDAAISAISSPSNFLTYNNSYPVSVTLVNNSCSATLTSATIEYKINGNGSPILGTYNWTGSLAPLASTPVSITPNFTATPQGYVTFKAFVSNANGLGADGNIANDTLEQPTWINDAAGAPTAYQGKDFWVAFMDNAGNTATLLQYIYLTSTQNATVTVSAPKAIPGTVWSTTVAVPANGFTIVTVPNSINSVVMSTPVASTETVSKTGINIVSNVDITVYALSTDPAASSDGYLAIPTANLGTAYTLIAAQGVTSATNGWQSEYVIVATQDNTNVTIKTSQKTGGGKAAGATWSVTLNKGQTYLVTSFIKNGAVGAVTYDMTGSVVTSDKPIGVFSGVQCTNVPFYKESGTCSYCNFMVEAMTPSTTWGKRFYSVDFGFKPTNDRFRVTTNGAGTTNYTLNGTAYTLTGQGSYRDHDLMGGVEIISDQPACLTQMCFGGQCAPAVSSDPFMVNIVPEEQWGNYYSFLANPDPKVKSNWLNIIKKGALSKVSIDGQVLSQSLFTQIGTTGFYYYQYNLAVAKQYIAIGDQPFICYVYGFMTDDGFGYPAGGASLAPASALPIRLMDFNAKAVNKQVYLTWSTATEQNNSYFEIERSSNGTVYNRIGEKIAGAGNSNLIQKYNTIDLQPFNGINYYRLKQVDINGDFTYSKIVSVDVTSKLIKNISVSPSPIKDDAMISFAGTQAGNLEAALYDISGRKIKDIEAFKVTEGTNTINISLGEFSKGFYFLRLTSNNGFQENIKLIKE